MIEISSKSRVRVDLRALVHSLLPMLRPSSIEQRTEGKMIETDQKMDVFLNGKMMDGLAVDSHIYTGTLSLRERRERRAAQI